MTWEEVELKNDMWTPIAEGDTILGVLIGSEDTRFGKEYTIQEEESKEMVKLPPHKIMQMLMSDVKVGSRLKIEYKGEKDINKAKPLQIYKLSVWKND